MRNLNNSSDKPICVIIPGCTESTSNPAYEMIHYSLEIVGWEVVPVDIDWETETFSEWLSQARQKVSELPAINMMLGFSMGAMMSLILATEFDVESVIAASPSPYFKEDLPYTPPSVAMKLGVKKMSDYGRYSRGSLVNIRANRIEALVGENDWPPLIPSAERLRELLVDKMTLTRLPGAPHRIDHPLYLPHVILAATRCTPKEMLASID